MGAKVAAPDKLVTAFIGDEAFCETAMDLETSVVSAVPILLVLLNNREHSLTQLAAMSGGRGVDPTLGPIRWEGGKDLAALCRALGTPRPSAVQDPDAHPSGAAARRPRRRGRAHASSSSSSRRARRTCCRSCSPMPEAIVDVEAGVSIERISTDHLFTEGPVWNSRRGFLLWSDDRRRHDLAVDARSGPRRLPAPLGQGQRPDATTARAASSPPAGRRRTVWRSEHGPLDRHAGRRATDGVQQFNTPNDIVVRSRRHGLLDRRRPAARRPRAFETGDDLQALPRHPGPGPALRTPASAGRLGWSTDDGAKPQRPRLLARTNRSSTSTTGPQALHQRLRGGGRRVARQRPRVRVRHGSATKVDVAGNVYCTGSEAVQVHDPAGQLLGRIPVPEKHSNLAWGEEGWSTLFVTSGSSVYRIPTTAHGVAV